MAVHLRRARWLGPVLLSGALSSCTQTDRERGESDGTVLVFLSVFALALAAIGLAGLVARVRRSQGSGTATFAAVHAITMSVVAFWAVPAAAVCYLAARFLRRSKGNPWPDAVASLYLALPVTLWAGAIGSAIESGPLRVLAAAMVTLALAAGALLVARGDDPLGQCLDGVALLLVAIAILASLWVVVGFLDAVTDPSSEYRNGFYSTSFAALPIAGMALSAAVAGIVHRVRAGRAG